MPATNVPCPRPSPGELPGSVLRLTFATMRPANSGRLASMPESTTAIVAAGAAAVAPEAQYLNTPVADGPLLLLVAAAASRTRASERIPATGVLLARVGM